MKAESASSFSCSASFKDAQMLSYRLSYKIELSSINSTFTFMLSQGEEAAESTFKLSTDSASFKSMGAGCTGKESSPLKATFRENASFSKIGLSLLRVPARGSVNSGSLKASSAFFIAAKASA